VVEKSMSIENSDILNNYLQKKGLTAPGENVQIRVLVGGVSAKTVYVDMTEPLVIKQALPQLKTASEWLCDPARILIEHLGLKWLHDHLPKGSVPKPILCDEENHLIVMEGIAPPVETLKEILLKGFISESYIRSFGELLGIIHKKGMNDSQAHKIFHNRDFFINLRMEPYYRYTSIKLPQFRSFYEDLIKSTLDHQVTLVHGDYSPKNILIKEERLILLDHEVMHYGDPTFDVGFSLTHFLSKANHLNDTRFVDAALLSWKSYRSVFNFEADNFEERCMKHLLGCMLARIYGKSPLEYLTGSEQKWQFKIVTMLINEIPRTLTQLFISYKNLLDERKN